jgi:hypothetical protein
LAPVLDASQREIIVRAHLCAVLLSQYAVTYQVSVDLLLEDMIVSNVHIALDIRDGAFSSGRGEQKEEGCHSIVKHGNWRASRD